MAEAEAAASEGRSPEHPIHVVEKLVEPLLLIAQGKCNMMACACNMLRIAVGKISDREWELAAAAARDLQQLEACLPRLIMQMSKNSHPWHMVLHLYRR